MSMLAERKRKQKWCLNPRGKEWSQDANKFGQKMLEKMGWQQGKGLGAKESGITEHIKISYKNDSKGMGYKESNNQWTEHETNFSALLESLTESDHPTKSAEIPVKSLVEKSQTSRARVHYHKFTKGKDLSRYSEKDLANIFGKTSLKEVTKKKEEIRIEEETDDKETESGFLFNAGSMRDYFKSKLSSFGKSNGFVVGSNGVLKKAADDESEGEERVGFGFKKEENPVKLEAASKRKSTEQVEDVMFSPKKKCKKEDKVKKTEETSMGISNPSFNPSATPIKVLRHKLEPIEESQSEETAEESCPVTRKQKQKRVNDEISNEELVEESPKKKKKMSKNDEAAWINPVFNGFVESEESTEVKENPYEIKVKEKKKKKKKKDNDNTVESSKNASTCDEIQENPYEVKVKKKRQEKRSELDNPCFNHTKEEEEEEAACQTEDHNPYEVIAKSKKKKKKNQTTSTIDTDYFAQATKKNTNNVNSAVENPCFDSAEDSSIDLSKVEDNPYEIKGKKKKKKKKKMSKKDDDVDLESANNENPYEVKAKKKTKTSKCMENDIETGIINPALDLNDSVAMAIDDGDLMLNIVSTPVTKDERKVNTDSLTKIDSVKRRKSVRFSDITQELIIPNKEELNERYQSGKRTKNSGGVDNENFDKHRNNLEENLDSISKRLDSYQAEMENDINEEKLKSVTLEDVMVGEMGNPHGENEQRSDGTLLKFKYANMTAKTPLYHLNKVGAKMAYKHLIKGDILVKFANTNLHEIQGYGVVSRSSD